MKPNKRLLSIFTSMAVTFSLCSNCILTKAADVSAEINFVGVDHSPLVAGDTETFSITSKNADLVQYRAFLNKEGTDDWLDITGGYTQPVDSKKPYVISSPNSYELGRYKLSVWVKAAGTNGKISNSNGDYDSYYIANVNCVEKDDKNRVYSDGNLDIAKDNYSIDEKVIINGIKNIRGMQSPYKYKLHIFNPLKGWVNDVTEYTDKIEWTPKEPGTYVLDVWATSSDSTAKYEAWKLKTITVSDNGAIKQDSIVLKNDNMVFGGTNKQDIKKINSDIYVKGNNITLQYLDVTGTIFIDPGSTGSANVNNVKATNVKVLSGATKSIHINSLSADILTADSSSDVRIECTDSDVKNTEIKTYTIIDNKSGSVGKITIKQNPNGEYTVVFSGTFKDDVVVEGPAILKTDKDAVVPNVKIATKSKNDKVKLDGTFNSVEIDKPASIELSDNASILTSLKVNAEADIKSAETSSITKVDVNTSSSANVKLDGGKISLIDVKSQTNLSLTGAAKTNVVLEAKGVTLNVDSSVSVNLDTKGNPANVSSKGTVKNLDLSTLQKSVQATIDSTNALIIAEIALANATPNTKAAAEKAVSDAKAKASSDLQTATQQGQSASGGTSGSSGGSSSDNSSDKDDTHVTATVITVPSIAAVDVANGTSITDVIAKLQNTIQVLMSDGTTQTANITWNVGTPAYNGSVAGTYVFKGTLSGVNNTNNLTANVNVIVAAPIATDTIVSSVAPLSDITVKNGTTLGAISLPPTVAVTMSDGTTHTADITWDLGTPVYDGSTAGTYVFNGTLKGVNNTNNLTARVNVIVSNVTITISKIINPVDIGVAFGTAFEAITGLPTTVTVNLSNGKSADLPVTWTKGSYDGTKAGRYALTGTLKAISGITVSSSNNATLYIVVNPIRVSSITLDKTTISMATSSSAIQLNASISPTAAGNNSITWMSSDPKVVTFATTTGSSIMVRPVVPGNAVITANADGIVASCSISVIDLVATISGPAAVSSTSPSAINITLKSAKIPSEEISIKIVNKMNSNIEFLDQRTTTSGAVSIDTQLMVGNYDLYVKGVKLANFNVSTSSAITASTSSTVSANITLSQTAFDSAIIENSSNNTDIENRLLSSVSEANILEPKSTIG